MIYSFITDLLMILSLSFSGSGGGEGLKSERQSYACTECHGDLVEKDMIHYPAEDDCNNCHESTGASHPSDSVGFSLMDTTPALCYYCHEAAAQKAHPHNPVVQGDCLACHDVHASSEPLLLRLPDSDLCLSCHNRDYRTDSSETLNIRPLVQEKMHVHSAIEGGGCMSCHQSHGSDFPALLVDRFPAEDYVAAKTENFELCFLCHDTDLLDAEETEWGTGFRNGRRNLHWLHINGNKGRNCRMCHNMHGSPQPFLVEDQISFGSWEMQMNFVAEEQGGSCSPGCHGKLSYQRSSL